jgi:hypothetical protein
VQTKHIVVAAILIAAIAGIAIATTVSSSMMTTDAKKGKGNAFGQCNKRVNEENRAANITGKAASDKRKAECAALKPGNGGGKGHSDFGQCNKKANEANRAANVTGKAASDARKAACAALHP